MAGVREGPRASSAACNAQSVMASICSSTTSTPMKCRKPRRAARYAAFISARVIAPPPWREGTEHSPFWQSQSDMPDTDPVHRGNGVPTQAQRRQNRQASIQHGPDPLSSRGNDHTCHSSFPRPFQYFDPGLEFRGFPLQRIELAVPYPQFCRTPLSESRRNDWRTKRLHALGNTADMVLNVVEFNFLPQLNVAEFGDILLKHHDVAVELIEAPVMLGLHFGKRRLHGGQNP